MGTYLATGIVQKIVIDKSRIQYPDITLDNTIQQLKKELNINYYDFSENIDEYFWHIKPQVLEKNLVEFLDAQFKIYTDEKDRGMQQVIVKLTEIKNLDQIIELAASNSLVHSPILG
jgi:hypothetical protein